jgi:ADP-heptose:LPS heptosyltransferase
VDADDIHRLTTQLRGMAIDEALILTSFHQTALPTALVLRLAGVERIAAVSTDYPGALLTTRIDEPPDGPEPHRMLAVAQAAGYRLPPGDDGALRVRRSPETAIERPYVVLHPGVDAPARAYPPELWRDVAALLVRNGRSVVVTGSAEEAPLTASIASAAPSRIVDLGGRTDLSTLAGVLAAADVVVVGNTGPAHLAAAVGAPVVSLFAPVVPAVRWAPYGERVTVLGDQEAPCRDSRARVCPVPGHPCLASVTPDDIVAALDGLDALHPVLVS